MNEEIIEKIQKIIDSPGTKEIINAKDFYFNEARKTMQEFIAFPLSEVQKEYLSRNKKDYEELKQYFEDSEDLYNLGSLIFRLISYCDSKAYRKNDFNLYDDKRVLAHASVRMNHWVEQLLEFKLYNNLRTGSIKNAIEYLLNPTDYFTMLSENHRSQISENLFNVPYNKSTFNYDFFHYFSDVSLVVKNTENYSHVLTRIAYGLDAYWKKSIIGLVCPDGTGWQESAILDSKNGNYIALWNHKKPNGTNSTFKLLRACIEEDEVFKIFYTSSHNVLYIAEIVDFATNQAELDKAKWPGSYGSIEWYHKDFSEYQDGNKNAAWVYLARKIYKVDPFPSSSFKFLKPFGYPSVGCQAPVVSYISNKDILLNSQMENFTNLLKYKKQIILQGPPGTGKTREAKLGAKEMLGLSNIKELENNDQYRFVQFHPSYTYEDFVRGIVAKPTEDGNGILYEAENKTLGKFAKNALDNFLASKGIVQNDNFESRLQILIDEVNTKVVKGDVYSFGDKSSAEIFAVGNDYFYYSFPKRKEIRYKLLFSDLEKIFQNRSSILIPIDLRDKEKDFQLTMKGKYPYYFMLLRKLESYNITGKPEDYTNLKKYVLVIDEINRANLSSVLGELIYALEYREKAVESMYMVNGSQKLILPPNLYIIGTMNTADRSVGHIDYAIKRRFAFVDVLPKVIDNSDEIIFNKELFEKISRLFITNFEEYRLNPKVKLQRAKTLSPEFRPEDIWLGHSYFIQKIDKDENGNEVLVPQDFSIRLEYEIKPILQEYVKDGVLIGLVTNEEDGQKNEIPVEDYIHSLS